MLNEANAILSHLAAQVVIRDCWSEARIASTCEFVLPTGKRADVFGVSHVGDTYIAEVKHVLSSSVLEVAIEKYARWANYLYVAIPAATEADVARYVPITDMPMAWHRVGVIGVYPGCFRVLRLPSYRQVGRFDKNDLRMLWADAVRR